MLRQRLLTALVLIPLVIWGVLALPATWLALILALFMLIGSWEWSRLVHINSVPGRVAYLVVAALVMGSLWLYARNPSLTISLMYIALGWWLLALLWVLQPGLFAGHSAVNTLIKAAAGLLVLVPAWLALITLHAGAGFGPWYLLFAMALSWVADTGAYFSGKRWGRHKLAPAVSPGKTREGVYGALLLVALYAALAGWQWELHSTQLLLFVVMCVVIAMASVLGDLFESLIKRHGGYKDSGAIFPGHGGVMDRIDSLTAVAPLFLLGMHWLGSSA